MMLASTFENHSSLSRSKYSWVLQCTSRMMLLASSTVTSPAHTETISSTRGRFWSSNSRLLACVVGTRRSSSVASGLWAHMTQAKTFMVSCRNLIFCQRFLSITLPPSSGWHSPSASTTIKTFEWRWAIDCEASDNSLTDGRFVCSCGCCREPPCSLAKRKGLRQATLAGLRRSLPLPAGTISGSYSKNT